MTDEQAKRLIDLSLTMLEMIDTISPNALEEYWTTKEQLQLLHEDINANKQESNRK